LGYDAGIASADEATETAPVTAPPPDRRARKKLATREALRDAALELFLEKGYAQTTIRDITDRADVGSRTFYRHFESKEDIALMEVADFFDANFAALASGPADEAPVASYFRVLGELEPDWTRSSEELTFLYDMVETDNSLNGRLYWLMMQHQARVEELFGKRLGLDPHDARIYALASVGTMTFLGSLILAVNGDRSRSTFSHAEDLLLHYADGVDPKAAKQWRARKRPKASASGSQRAKPAAR
jgi:AcrR family transcriptional regulator